MVNRPNWFPGVGVDPAKPGSEYTASQWLDVAWIPLHHKHPPADTVVQFWMPGRGLFGGYIEVDSPEEWSIVDTDMDNSQPGTDSYVELDGGTVYWRETLVPNAVEPGGAELINSVRAAQLRLGYTPEHDVEKYRDARDLITAARCYAEAGLPGRDITSLPAMWPWGADWWRPTTPIHNLAKAGALIAAAIDVIVYQAKQGRS